MVAVFNLAAKINFENKNELLKNLYETITEKYNYLK